MLILAWIAVIVPSLLVLFFMVGVMTDGYDPEALKAFAAFVGFILVLACLVCSAFWGVAYIADHKDRAKQPITLEAK